MSKLYEVLKDVIEDEVQIEFDEENHCLVLTEEQNKGSKVLKSVRFKLQYDHSKPKNYIFHFAFKLDDERYKFLGQLFNRRLENIRKAVDAVVFCEFRNHNNSQQVNESPLQGDRGKSHVTHNISFKLG